MLTNTKSRKAILFYLVVFLSFFSCDKIGNETSTGIEDQFLEKASSNTDLSMSQKKNGYTLKCLGRFETLEALGFSPDDATFSPEHGGRLFLSATADAEQGTQKVFEVTLSGKLIRSFDLPVVVPILGYSIARVSSGPKVGHFFLIQYSGGAQVQVWEFDQAFNKVNQFQVDGEGNPGDAIAYNRRTGTLMITDPSPSGGKLIEVTTNGKELTSFPAPGGVNGMTFNETTGTYFGVMGGSMVEFSTSEIIINSYDLSGFGVTMAVGIAYGQGMFFIADEGRENDIGYIYIVQVSK
jgi:hypothetical protein